MVSRVLPTYTLPSPVSQRVAEGCWAFDVRKVGGQYYDDFLRNEHDQNRAFTGYGWALDDRGIQELFNNSLMIAVAAVSDAERQTLVETFDEDISEMIRIVAAHLRAGRDNLPLSVEEAQYILDLLNEIPPEGEQTTRRAGILENILFVLNMNRSTYMYYLQKITRKDKDAFESFHQYLSNFVR